MDYWAEQVHTQEALARLIVGNWQHWHHGTFDNEQAWMCETPGYRIYVWKHRSIPGRWMVNVNNHELHNERTNSMQNSFGADVAHAVLAVRGVLQNRVALGLLLGLDALPWVPVPDPDLGLFWYGETEDGKGNRLMLRKVETQIGFTVEAIAEVLRFTPPDKRPWMPIHNLGRDHTGLSRWMLTLPPPGISLST